MLLLEVSSSMRIDIASSSLSLLSTPFQGASLMLRSKILEYMNMALMNHVTQTTTVKITLSFFSSTCNLFNAIRKMMASTELILNAISSN